MVAHGSLDTMPHSEWLDPVFELTKMVSVAMPSWPSQLESTSSPTVSTVWAGLMAGLLSLQSVAGLKPSPSASANVVVVVDVVVVVVVPPPPVSGGHAVATSATKPKTGKRARRTRIRVPSNSHRPSVRSLVHSLSGVTGSMSHRV